MTTQYRTIREEVKRFGKNSYLEVSRQRITDRKGATDFLVVTRGFFQKDGSRTWTRFVTIPDEKEMKAWLRDALGKV